MQGYKKNDEQRAFEKKVAKIFMIHHVFYSKNYGEEVNEFSKPDFFICIHGRFLGVEIDFYTPDENGEKPKLSQHVIDSIIKNKGGLMIVSPDTFEQFEKEFIKAVIALQKGKPFADKVIEGLKRAAAKKAKKANKHHANTNEEKPQPQPQPPVQPKPQPKREFIVEVKKKPLFQRKTDAFYQQKYNQEIEKKSRFS